RVAIRSTFKEVSRCGQTLNRPPTASCHTFDFQRSLKFQLALVQRGKFPVAIRSTFKEVSSSLPMLGTLPFKLPYVRLSKKSQG
ncbi:hypothetical protein, partial [Limnospira platensis]|uniref:hypothetical protein n=1 Tax=Limnospira platensis TaxID=118562 RepID=UPI0025706B9A